MVTSAPTVENGDGGSDELPRPCCGCHSMSYGRSKGWVGMWLVTSVDTDAEGSMMPGGTERGLDWCLEAMSCDVVVDEGFTSA